MTGESDSSAARLLGAWHLVRAEAPLELQPGTRMAFGPAGRLDYAITVEGQTTHFELLYHVDGDVLRTESQASPHSTAVHFEVGRDDVLTLDFGGPRAWFAREYR